MKNHEWVMEEIDGGHVGSADFWKCKNCGASGGWVNGKNPPTMPPFLADGSGLKLSNDCDEAQKEIQRHSKLSPDEKKAEWAARIRAELGIPVPTED